VCERERERERERGGERERDLFFSQVFSVNEIAYFMYHVPHFPFYPLIVKMCGSFCLAVIEARAPFLQH